VEDGIEVREGRRLREEFECDAVTGIVRIEKIARIGKEPPAVLGRPELVDRVVLLEPGPRLRSREGRAIGGDADLPAAELACQMYHHGKTRAGVDPPRIKQRLVRHEEPARARLRR